MWQPFCVVTSLISFPVLDVLLQFVNLLITLLPEYQTQPEVKPFFEIFIYILNMYKYVCILNTYLNRLLRLVYAFVLVHISCLITCTINLLEQIQV